MQVTRRNFLQTIGTAAAVVVSGTGLNAFGQDLPGDLFPIPAEAYSDPLFSISARHFEGLLGTTFTVTAAGGRSVRLTLTQVNSLERQANVLRGFYGESFSLIFETQQRLRLSQGIYHVAGSGLDLNTVLLVPTGIERRHYEIIINHVTR